MSNSYLLWLFIGVKAVQYSAVLHPRRTWITSPSTMTAPPLNQLIVTLHKSLHGVDTSSTSLDGYWKPLHPAMSLDGADQGHNRVPCFQTAALAVSLSATHDCGIVDAAHQFLEEDKRYIFLYVRTYRSLVGEVSLIHGVTNWVRACNVIETTEVFFERRKRGRCDTSPSCTHYRWAQLRTCRARYYQGDRISVVSRVSQSCYLLHYAILLLLAWDRGGLEKVWAPVHTIPPGGLTIHTYIPLFPTRSKFSDDELSCIA
jgi:hypothetical protein